MRKFIFLVCLSLGSAVHAEMPSSTGPALSEEAKLTYEQGVSAFAAGQFENAIRELKRYVDRFPGHPNYIEAKRILGLSLMQVGKSKEAIVFLRDFVEVYKSRPEGLATQLVLGQALLNIGKNHEALLISDELVKAYKNKKASVAVYLDSLLLKSNCQLELRKDEMARRTLDAFEHEGKGVPGLDGSWSQYYHLRVVEKLRACEALTEAKTLREEIARKKFRERGVCLVETLKPFTDAVSLTHPDWTWTDRMTAALDSAFMRFQSGCASPPPPPGKRTERELAAYRSELAEVLKTDCREATTHAVPFLKAFLSKWDQDKTQHLRSKAISKLVGAIEP